MGLITHLPCCDINVIQHGHLLQQQRPHNWVQENCIHGVGGLMKSLEDGSMLSFDSIPASTFGSRSDPWLHSSHVVSFSPMYMQPGGHIAGEGRCTSSRNQTTLSLTSYPSQRETGSSSTWDDRPAANWEPSPRCCDGLSVQRSTTLAGHGLLPT
jgi:hypothetical protein